MLFWDFLVVCKTNSISYYFPYWWGNKTDLRYHAGVMVIMVICAIIQLGAYTKIPKSIC